MAKNNLSQWSLTLLRLVLGFIFAYHGYLKLFAPGVFNGTVAFLTAVKIPMPLYAALVVSVLEFAGGILLLLGIASKWVASALFVEMLVAFFKVHLGNGLLIGKAYGYEYVLVLLACLVVIIVNGSGRLSIGKFFKSRNLH